MTRPTHLPLLLNITSVLLIASAYSAFAAWPPNGKALTRAPGVQDSPSAVSDGANGAFVVWRDERDGGSDLYANRIRANGRFAPGWAMDGVLLATSRTAGPPTAFSDGSGGLCVIWSNGPGAGFFMQHMRGDGTLAPGWPAEGRNLVAPPVGGPSGTLLRATPDGAGGFYLLWNAYLGSDRLLLQRVSADGTAAPGWAAPVDVGSDGGFGGRFTGIGLCADAAGPIVGYSNRGDLGIGVFSDVFVRALGPDATDRGFFLLTNFAGSGIHTLVDVQSDGTGGAFVQCVGTPGPGSLVRVVPGATGSWTLASHLATTGAMRLDGAGGCVVVGGSALTADRRARDGSTPAGWTGNGLALASGYVDGGIDARSIPGGTLVCWSEQNGALGNDIRATAFGDDGALMPGWSAGGTLISGARRAQTAPSLAALADGRGIVAWQDARRRNETDIFARIVQPVIAPAELEADENDGDGGSRPIGANQRLGAPDPTPLSISVTSRGPNAEARVHAAAIDDAIIDVVDVSGRTIAHATISPSSAGDLVLALPLGEAPRGLYWARVRQGARTATVRFVHSF